MWPSLSHVPIRQEIERRIIKSQQSVVDGCWLSAAFSSYPLTSGKGLLQELRPLLDLLLLFDSLDEDADFELLPELDELPLFACFWLEPDDLSDFPLFCCEVAMTFSSINDYGCAARSVRSHALTT